MDNDNGTLRGLRDLLKKRKGMTPPPDPKAFADGGEVTEDEINQMTRMNPLLASQQPAVPPLSEVTSTLNKTPDTNYDFYGDLGADKRKALFDRLMASKGSGGSMVSSGLAGLGDAISNSYGGKNTTFMKDRDAAQDKSVQDTLGGFDTQRAQKAQDVAANQDMSNNDPKSPLSKGMQEILRSKGIQVPSGMSASMLVKVMGPLGDMAMKEAAQMIQAAQLKETQSMNAFNRDLNANKLIDERKNAENAAREKESQNKFDAAKGLNSRSTLAKVGDFFSKSDATKEMENQLSGGADHGVPDLGSTFNGGKVKKVTRIQ